MALWPYSWRRRGSTQKEPGAWRPTLCLHCTAAKEELKRPAVGQIKSQEQLAAELTKYTTTIALLEEMLSHKEDKVEEWQHRAKEA